MEISDLPQILRLLAAMAFVLALMGGLALTLKRLGLSAGPSAAPKKKRLKIIEALPLDARRRAVLIQRDDIQHLVILGPNGETIVETDIEPAAENRNLSEKITKLHTK